MDKIKPPNPKFKWKNGRDMLKTKIIEKSRQQWKGGKITSWRI